MMKGSIELKRNGRLFEDIPGAVKFGYIHLRGLRACAKITSQNWRLNLGQIWLRRLSKSTGIVVLFRGFCD